jgi:hypothetical protein
MHLKSDYSVLNLSSPCTFEISKEGMTTRIFWHCFIKLTNTNGNTDKKLYQYIIMTFTDKVFHLYLSSPNFG